MLLDVLIPTSGNLQKVQPLLHSIAQQTLLPDRIVLLIHKELQREELELFHYFVQRSLSEQLSGAVSLITNLTSDYQPGYGVGHDRNVLVSHASAKYVYMIDHDNEFGPELFEQTADRRVRLHEQLSSDLLISPTIIRRETAIVQSQGVTTFRYRWPKYEYGRMTSELWQQVKMIGANSLFGPRRLFEQFLFDERFARNYEDIDMTYRLTQAGYPLVVLNKVEIRHMERHKSALDKLFLGDPDSAYERARNRIWMVKKVATRWQQVQYFGCGLRVQTVWFAIQIIWRGGGQRWQLVRAVWRGTRDGLTSG